MINKSRKILKRDYKLTFESDRIKLLIDFNETNLIDPNFLAKHLTFISSQVKKVYNTNLIE